VPTDRIARDPVRALVDYALFIDRLSLSVRIVFHNSIAAGDWEIEQFAPSADAGACFTVTSSASLQFLILLVATWLGRSQREAIEYLRAENPVLRSRLGPKRLRFADAERLIAGRASVFGPGACSLVSIAGSRFRERTASDGS
jgi:hypothetical protein